MVVCLYEATTANLRLWLCLFLYLTATTDLHLYLNLRTLRCYGLAPRNPSIELFSACFDETRSPSGHVLDCIAVAIEELLVVVLEEGNGILWFLYQPLSSASMLVSVAVDSEYHREHT